MKEIGSVFCIYTTKVRDLQFFCNLSELVGLICKLMMPNCSLSGLIVDIFGDEAVVASSAAWVEKYKQQISFRISKLTNVNHITWRPSVEILKEEGLDLSDSADVDLSNSPRMTKVRLLECEIIFAT